MIFLILIGFAVTLFDDNSNDAYGLWVSQSPEELLEQSETVFVGTVISVNVLEFERSNTYNVEENGVSRTIVENYTQTLDKYTVDIEEFLKNPQTSNTITMLEATVGGVHGRNVSIGGFELGDRVLFYVPKIDGINQYSPESQIILTDNELFYFQDEFKKFSSNEVDKVNDVDFPNADGEIIEKKCIVALRGSTADSFTDQFSYMIQCQPFTIFLIFLILSAVIIGFVFVVWRIRK